MGLITEQNQNKIAVLIDGTSSAGKSQTAKMLNAIPYYESNDPNRWVVIDSDHFVGFNNDGEKRRLELDHPNIRSWAQGNEVGMTSGIYRKDGVENIPENPYEDQYLGGDIRAWYMAQVFKTGPWKKVIFDDVSNTVKKYVPEVKDVLLHAPIYILLQNVGERNVKGDTRKPEMVLKQYLEKYEATKERPSENTGDPSTILTKKGLQGLLSKSISDKTFIDSFISQLGITDDGEYYIKVKDDYLSPDTQLINVDSERTVYLDKFKEIVQNS